MNIKEIAKGVYYVGINDRTSHLFERIWPLPNGVTYNAYLIVDNKTVMIDTVEIGEAHQFFRDVEKFAPGRKIDYLVINHMEPDHSGCIPLVKEKFPDVKIVGNAKTVEMIKGYYGISDPDSFHVVADGDTLELGDNTLRFFLTPMVHWPETMMTYIEQQGVLFSGDAFGAFGALNGVVVDRNMNCDLYFREMYRYYSNIVGKYGAFVQKALAKLASVKLEYICPTHGPVWNQYIKETVDIYDRLSRYEAERGVVVAYGSMYGHTAAIADRIASAFAARGIRNIRVHDLTSSPLSEVLADVFRYKGLVIGSPTYSMTLFPPVEALFLALQTREVKNRVIATFGGFTWASMAPRKMREYAERMKLDIVDNLEMKQAIEGNVADDIQRLADSVVAAL